MNFPVSIKGVLRKGGSVLLLRNDRDEWELPGGRIEIGESPEDCLKREMAEELGLDVEVVRIVDCQLFEVVKEKYVFLAIYCCSMLDPLQRVKLSSEHLDFRWFDLAELPGIPLPGEYLVSILKAFADDEKAPVGDRGRA